MTNKSEMFPFPISAKKFAQKAVKRQKSAFRQWGVMADWNGGCYFTNHPQYEANQLEIFFQMHERVNDIIIPHS